MADTVTTNYNLIKPEVGASSNTWGGKLNDNWDEVDGLLKSLNDGLAAAVAAYTAADVLAKIKTVDGAGSGLDADLLDGNQGAFYADITGRLGFTPVQQGTGTGQNANVVKIGWSSASGQIRVQVDTTDFGATWPININGVATTATLAADSNKLGGFLPADYRDASKLTGALADARLSNNVPFKNVSNTFTAGQVNSGVVGNKTIANYVGYADLQIQGSSGGAALMSFHRPGAFAAYLGLDTDNKLKFGGWSVGAVGYEIVHTGNIATLAPSVGVGQTWQDVTASRAKDTVYQNTTGKPIQTAIQGRGQSGILSVSHDNVAWIGVGQTAGLTNGYQSNIDIIVPNGYYYRLAGTDSIARWVELR
jgi:hypothetical protein